MDLETCGETVIVILDLVINVITGLPLRKEGTRRSFNDFQGQLPSFVKEHLV